jgi:quercetin dioxygenase-like cupin family protein
VSCAAPVADALRMTDAHAIFLPLAGAASRRIHNPIQRDAATFLETSEETGGARTLVELEIAPGGRVNPHEHTTYIEYFAVHRGRLTVRVDDAEVHLGPGDEAIVPAGAVHSWANEGDDRAMAVLELQPGHAGFEKALRVAYGLASDGLVNSRGVPRNPLHTALLLDWSEGRLAGSSALLSRPLALLARLARARGVDRELERRYGVAAVAR